MIQGYLTDILDDSPYSFAQGKENLISGGGYSMVQGFDVTISGRQTLAQGYDITLAPYIGGSSGSANNYTNLAQGSNITLYSLFGGYNLVQGYNIQTAYASYGTYASLLQGAYLDVPYAWYSIVQGTTITANSFGCLISGQSMDVTGHLSLFQGADHTTTGVGYITQCFVQGNGIALGGSEVRQSFVQGRHSNMYASRAFAQGAFCDVQRDDQKTWGSNRGSQFSRGTAQSSKIIKHVATTDAAQTTLITLDLEEDKTYSLRIMVAAHDTTTDDESACFSLSHGLARRNTGGSAVLAEADSAGEVILTAASIGTDSLTWGCKLVESGNDILLEVIGSATDRIEWCADFEFVEVKG